jgi:hypothetical protein
MALSKNRVPEEKMHLQTAFGGNQTYKGTLLQNPAPTFLFFSALFATGTNKEQEQRGHLECGEPTRLAAAPRIGPGCGLHLRRWTKSQGSLARV